MELRSKPGSYLTLAITREAGDPPAVIISAEPEAVYPGESFTLTWTTTDANSVSIDNGIGSVPLAGAISVSPEYTTTYTITVTGAAGSGDAAVTVMVTGDPVPLPEGSFGEQYNDLIPPDATVEEYAPKRFSLITGFVQSMGGSPISGVSVTIHGHCRDDQDDCRRHGIHHADL